MVFTSSNTIERKMGSPVFTSWADEIFKRMNGNYKEFSEDVNRNLSKSNLPEYKITNTKDKLHKIIELSVPGYLKEQLKVQFNEVELGIKTSDTARLVVSGSIKNSESSPFTGSFDFTLDLPIKTKFKEAKLENGILRIVLTNPPIETRQEPKFVEYKID